jgi:predicted ATP-binding protein involved in virulence
MKIHSIRIVDFRGIEDRTFDFNSSFNVLIGENGSGKTSVLEALAAGINSYVAISQGRNVRPIRKEDVRVETFGHNIEKKTKTSLTINGEIDGQRVSWEIRKVHFDYGFRHGNETEIKNIAKEHFIALSENGGKNISLPVFDYLGCGRLFSEPSKSLKTLPKGSRYEGYYNCLDSTSSIKRFAAWFKTMELSLLQGNETAKWRAQVIKSAVSNCLEGWETIFFGIEEDQLMALKHSNKKEILPFSYLSDGQRNIVGIVADIAYRCVLLNPYLELNATKESSGIVLIDELDLHLHPKWQRTIVNKLKETFPNLQFITTTHSPFIVQSLKKEELIPLEENLIIDTDPFRKSIEEGAADYMLVDDVERSFLFKEMEKTAAEYYDLIETQGDQNQISKLESRLNELEERFGDDPAFVALLKAERKSK